MALPGTFETLDPNAVSEWSVNFTNYRGTSTELSGIITQMSIFESIYNNCMFGNIKVADGTGFVEAHGIVGSGAESVHFDIFTANTVGPKSANLEKVFTIDSISNGVNNPKFIEYDIGMVSPYLLINNKKKISRSFTKMTASEIVDYVGVNIMEFEGGLPKWSGLKTTPTLHEKNTVVPSWNPFQLINFLAKNSVSEEGASDFLFFENNEGFKFITIDELKAGPIKRMFVLSNTNRQSLVSVSGKGIDVDDAQMENYIEKSRFNITNGQTEGQYASSILTHNILEKRLDKYEVEYDGEKDKIVAEGIGLNGPPGMPFKDFNIWQNSGFMSSNYLYDIHDKGEKSHYPWYTMKKAELTKNVIQFDVPGDSNLFAGDVVAVQIPTHLFQHKLPEDQYVTGKWLVTAIHHKINNDGYVMTVECMKDGFFSDPDVTIPARAS